METVTMSRKERKRLEVLSRVKRRELTLVKGAELLGLSYRQAKRVYARYGVQGDAGLVHGLRGRPSNRGGASGDRDRAMALYREKYADFGPTLASEYLARDEGLPVAVTTLWRWLKQAGLWQPRRKRSPHRRWRPRKEHSGEMVQMDGSEHDWFEGRRAKASLMVMIDDATNRTYARFFERETTVAAMTTFGRYVEQYRVPRSLYVDRDSIYEPTRDATTDEELRGKGPLTQFGRAMEALELKLILAYSPQAKGRVERRHQVFQDRLIKAMRLAKISDLAAANQFLERNFLPDLNGRFTVAPKRRADLHRRVPRDVKLERVLSFQESRVVQNDWTVQWRNRYFQLTEENHKLSLVRRRIIVLEQLDQTIHLLYRGRDLAWHELPERPRWAKPSGRNGPTGTGRTGQRPPADHPWRHPLTPAPAAATRPPCSAPVACAPCATQGGRKPKKTKKKPQPK